MSQRDHKKLLLGFAIFLVLAGIALRVLRHYEIIHLPPNFAPVAAIAMFSAVYLPRRLAIAVPLMLMLLSDALIGWYETVVVLSVYFSFGLSLLLGFWIRRQVNPRRMLLASLAGSIAFFLITNAAVWQYGHGYPPGLIGLWESYVSGLPFFRNTLLGDLVYTGAFFGLYNAVVVYSSKRLAKPDSALTHG